MKAQRKLASLLLLGIAAVALIPLCLSFAQTAQAQAAQSDVRLVYFMDGTDDDARVIETKLLYEGDTLDTAQVVYREEHEELIGWFSDKALQNEVASVSYDDLASGDLFLYPKVAHGVWIVLEAEGGSYTVPLTLKTMAGGSKQRRRSDALVNGFVKEHYGKVIALCCFLMMFANIGLPSTSFSVYQPYIVELPGMTDSLGSLVVTLRLLSTLVSMVFVGRFFKVFSYRVGAAVACALTGIGFCLFALADGFVLLAAGAVLAGMGYGFGGMVCMTLLVNRWYRSNVGAVIGFAGVGSGVASILVPPVATLIIEGHALPVAFLLEGVLAFVIGALLLLLVRNSPDELGIKDAASAPQSPEEGRESLQEGSGEGSVEEDANAVNVSSPANAVNASSAANAASAPPPANAAHAPGPAADPTSAAPTPTPPLRKSLTSAHHAVLYLAVLIVGATCISGVAYLSILLQTNGFDSVFAAQMLTVFGVCLTVSKYITGKVFDKIGSVKASVVWYLFSLAGVVLCAVSGDGDHLTATIGVALLGVGLSIGNVAVPIWSLDLSDEAGRAKLVKNLQLSYNLGGLAFNLVPGILMDLFGNYIVSYVILAILLVCSLAMLLSTYRHRFSA